MDALGISAENIKLVSVKIVILIFSLMVLQKILQEFGIITILSKAMNPVMVLMGLPESTSFLWLVANIIGLSYGSAILIDELENNKISVKDSDLLNQHIAISHSLLEDTLLFVAIGVSAFWITVPRIALAVAVVWLYRLFLHSYNLFFNGNMIF